MATFIAKITKLSQFNSAAATIIWADSTPKRWTDIYGRLKIGDNCIFLSGSELYVGDYASSITNISITFNNIKSIQISTDDLLRINVLNPESLAVLKRPPGPMLKNTINVNDVYNAASSKEFISFYIIRLGHEAELLNMLKQNDRVITIDQNDKLIEMFVFADGKLQNKSFDVGYFNAKDKSLSDIFALIKKLGKKNLIRNIQRIIDALSSTFFYKFPSFNDYYNIIHNKRLYSNNPPVGNDRDIELGEVYENDDDTETTKNIILYGPPGTGKTYSTINVSLEILGEDVDGIERTKVKKLFSEYQEAKQIYFTTFHQNMSYEDFIEGIKPSDPEEDDEYLKYEIQDGLFMQASVEAAYNYIMSNFSKDNSVKELVDFNSLFDKLFERISNAGHENLVTKSGGKISVLVTSQGNFSITHEGRNKPYTVSRDRLSRIYELYPNPDNIPNIENAFRQAIGGCNSTAYWSVLNAIVNIRKSEDGKDEKTNQTLPELSYGDKRKIVQKYWDKKDYSIVQEDQSSPYVFIIDEINRGNVAQIFGELITLIEDDKRMGKMETLYADLPYSKLSFAVPPNLYIIGTMNTADRSVETLDTALRRRFSFIPKLPEEYRLEDTADGIELSKLLLTLNKRLKVLKDQDHTIGHAWLWNVTDVEGLKIIFANKILPLLQEYFYNDYEKLGLVLGDRFFKIKEQVSGNIFAKFSGGNGLAGQYDQSWLYELKPASELTIEDFLSLYTVVENEE